jgi:PPOX class probable F420-dependent enzyme
MLLGTRTGKLATVRLDGRPHVVPIWFVLDGDDVVFTAWHRTVKAGNLAANSRAAMAVDSEVPPFAFVTVEGDVSLSDDLEDLSIWTTRIGARYMGEANAEQFGRRNAMEGEVLVRLHINKMIAQDGISD